MVTKGGEPADFKQPYLHSYLPARRTKYVKFLLLTPLWLWMPKLIIFIEIGCLLNGHFPMFCTFCLYRALLRHVCPKCPNTSFKTFQALADHAEAKHKLFYCYICVQQCKVRHLITKVKQALSQCFSRSSPRKERYLLNKSWKNTLKREIVAWLVAGTHYASKRLCIYIGCG